MILKDAVKNLETFVRILMSKGPWLDLCSAWERLAWSSDPCQRGLSCGGVEFSIG